MMKPGFLWVLAVMVAGCQAQPVEEPSAWAPVKPQVLSSAHNPNGPSELSDHRLQVGGPPPPRPSNSPTVSPLAPLQTATTAPLALEGTGYPSHTSAHRGHQPGPQPQEGPESKQTQSAQNGLLEVNVESSSDGLSGASSQQIVYLLVEIAPRSIARPASLSCDLALVIDISGSMAGAGLDLAAAAAAKIFAQAGPADRGWLVAFANSAAVLVEASPSRPDEGKIRQLLQSAALGGGTAMATGAELALQELHSEAPSTRARHIILVTDGMTGDASRSQEVCLRAWKEGISVSCVGIGQCNSQLLQTIADHCSGQFYPLQSLAGLPDVLTMESRLARTIWLRDVRVSARMSPGVSLRRAFRPQPFREYRAGDDNPYQVGLGDIHKNETLRLLLELEVKPGAGRERSLAHIDVLARDPDAREREPQPVQQVKISNGLAHPTQNGYVMKLVDRVYTAMQRGRI